MSLYKIGDISKICDISIKALRYYEALGLITPAEVDPYTGYRYYDQKNVEHVYTIQLLKDLNFTLDEIKNYSESSLDKKYVQIKKEIRDLKKKLELIASLKVNKGDGIMKCFVNDENAIGKWKYVCSTISREAYDNNDTFEDNDALMQDLYFLPNGEGYWFMDRWTEGIIYHYAGRIMKYTIENEILFLEVYDENQEFEILLVFKKIDSKQYKKSELERQDDVDLPFICDENALGYWMVVDWIGYNEKENYVPKSDTKEYFLKSLNLLPNGECYKEFNNGNIIKINWTSNYILQKKSKIASSYILQKINGDDYMIMDWKSGDYVYGGKIYGCYVLKKVKSDSSDEKIM